MPGKRRVNGTCYSSQPEFYTVPLSPAVVGPERAKLCASIGNQQDFLSLSFLLVSFSTCILSFDSQSLVALWGEVLILSHGLLKAASRPHSYTPSTLPLFNVQHGVEPKF
ncbi:hypothetical protein LZ554_007967 [Drepanopeziza brunnea f. sp. 'monogermtubi']|nr:hypothetical protein LZ554_007967 [Drepanopeziza brunnea f. sp. 'monogermtubi']